MEGPVGLSPGVGSGPGQGGHCASQAVAVLTQLPWTLTAEPDKSFPCGCQGERQLSCRAVVASFPCTCPQPLLPGFTRSPPLLLLLCTGALFPTGCLYSAFPSLGRVALGAGFGHAVLLLGPSSPL